VANAQWLEITVATNKQEYNVKENVIISGTLRYDGTPVNGTLIGLEIRDRASIPFVFRTLPCGTITQTNWLVDITVLYPCNSNGVPKYSFQKGEAIYFFCTVKNFDLYADHYVMLCVTLYDANNVPIFAECSMDQTITEGSSASIFSMLLRVESGMASGTYKLYANVFDGYPKNSGLPYCPEKMVNFTVTASSSVFNPQFSLLQAGTYQTSYYISSQLARLGNFTVYVSAYYRGLTATANTIFTVILKGDINNDKTVNFLDAILLGAAYGTGPQDPNWNPNADLNKDNIVNYLDAIILGANYGATGW